MFDVLGVDMPNEQNKKIYYNKKIVIVFALICLLTTLSIVAFGENQTDDTAPSGSTTWKVMVGGQAAIEPQEYGPAGAWQFMRFYPDNITINVGDKIEWILNSAEPHTVTFLGPGKKMPDLIVPENNSSARMMFNPLVILAQGGQTYNGTMLTGSGQMDVPPQFPKEYNLTFTKPGDFEYLCAFHNMMKGKVIVQAAGTAYPKTQEQINAEAAKLLAEDMELALEAGQKAENAVAFAGSNGTTRYEVKMGYGDGNIALMRFIPTNLTIHAGDVVEWTRGDVETPHTITFLSGGKEPELVLIEPQQRGPPKFVLNPLVLAPAGGKVYSGKGYYNSGLIWGTMVPLPGPQGYNLTFDTPGAYDYICVLHDYMGMKGQIKVLP